MTQFYLTEAENEYVIRGNSAVVKCKIPSFVADFVQVDAWVADDGHVHSYNDASYDGTRWKLRAAKPKRLAMCPFPFLVANSALPDTFLVSSGSPNV